jgi:predicted NBD/HSP70 family sugar kinase
LWGIDLGGTKIEGVVVAESDPSTPLARIRRPTESARGYPHIIGQIAAVVRELSDLVGQEPQRIGIGTPGAVDPATGRMKNSNTQCLNGTFLRADLVQALKVPCEFSNDANCFALAEAVFGAGKGAPVVFGVILGTGVGGGVVVNGRALSGRNGIAGEWGHNVLDPAGVPCYCGKRGCVEACISGPALERWYATHSGKTEALSEIVLRAERGGDPSATATIERLCSEFARAIAVVINILDPDVIVIGGGVSNIDALYLGLEERMKPFVFDTSAATPVLRNQLGDSAGVFGAALLGR